MSDQTYGTAETKADAANTLCHIARNPSDVLNVVALCGVRLPWILGEYPAVPSGWNLCIKCREKGA